MHCLTSFLGQVFCLGFKCMLGAIFPKETISSTVFHSGGEGASKTLVIVQAVGWVFFCVNYKLFKLIKKMELLEELSK